MSFLSRLSSLFALKQKTAVKLIAIMSVFAFVINLTPELYRDVASQASEEGGEVTAASPPTAPTGKFIVVGENGSTNTDATACIIRTSSFGYTVSETNTCNINEAAMRAQSDTTTDAITIVVSDAIPTINLDTDVIHVQRNSTGLLTFNGIKSNGTTKTVITDGNTGHATRFYAFALNESSSHVKQNITITNFAFTQMQALSGGTSAAAISTDGVTGLTNIGHLTITDNYFGTTDGQTLIQNNFIFQGIRLALDAQVTQANINISGNNFYNVVSPIQIFSFDNSVTLTQTQTSSRCISSVNPAEVIISNNVMGTAKNFAVNTSVVGEGAWSGAAINICSVGQLRINGNTIANSLGSGLDFNTGLRLDLGNANRFDTGIYLKRSSGIVSNNLIGGNLLGSTLEWAIFGYGIYIDDTFRAGSGQSTGFLVSNNVINNIWPPAGAAFDDACAADRYSLTSEGRACGGSAIVLDSTRTNYITYNYIGNPIFNNWGYGIEIKSEFKTVPPLTGPVQFPSYDNKIFKNSIYYNKADGVLVDTINRPETTSVGSTCTATGLGGSSVVINNCRNTIFQNLILRNGNYNGSTFGDISPSPEGGIGIDLKAISDTTEQKYGLVQFTGSGTLNDTDISLNDSNDADLGGNGILNTAVIHGSGATENPTTFETIRGDISALQNGKYWVEVFTVNCPAELLSTTPIINTSNAANNCDTDSRPGGDTNNPSRATYGQGAIFLCGVYLEKTATAGSDQWECSPDEFNTTFNGGLLTSTVTTVEEPSIRLNYESAGPSGSSFIPGYDTSPLTFSCELLDLLFTNITPCTDVDSRSEGVHPGEYQAIFLSYVLQDTSEFSANTFIASGSIGTSKTVRECTSSSSCNTATFTNNVNRIPGEYVEFKIEMQNDTGDLINPTFSDALPAQLEWVSGSCQVFSGMTNSQSLATGARPTLSLESARPCTISGQNISYASGGSQIANGQKRAVYAIARVRTTSPSGVYTNIATMIAGEHGCLTAEPCRPSATVTVAAAPVSELVKTIQPGNLHTHTLTAPTTNSTVNYQIKVVLTGLDKDNIETVNITDNFPRIVRSGTFATYSNCRVTVQVNTSPVGPARDCANISLINSTDTTPVTIWDGTMVDYIPALEDQLTVTITYQSSVPPLTTTDTTNATLTNTARLNRGTSVADQDSTTLIITPPTVAQQVVPTFHKQVRACTGTTVDTCTGAFSETGLSNVAPGSTVEFRFEATSSSGATFAFRDPAPTGITFATSANSCLAYAGIAQLGGSAARPTTGSSPCTFDSTSGTQVLNTSNVTIAANQYAYVYALATISSTATGTITNTAGLNGNGCSTTVAQCNDPAAITITATTPGQVSIDKQVNPTAVTSSATTQDVTYTIVLTKPNTFAINNANWTDTFPTTPVALSNYTCTSVTVLPAGSQSIACPTTFPPAGNTLFTGTINAAVTSITITYTARVPANAALTTAQSVINTTSITGSRSTDAVAISQTDTATLTVNPANNTGTPVVSLSKRADNGVTTSDRSTEKIYKPGDTVNYTLSMLNSGTSAATSVSLQDLFHSMLKSMTINALPAGATQSLTTTAFNFGNITVPTGTTPTTVTYHGTIADNDNFDLDLFDLDEGSNPTRDDDFYASEDADIDDDLGTSNNSHRRAEDILGAPDNKFVSLGSDGEMTIDLGTKVIVNGSGDDFALRTINQSVDDTDQAGEDLKVSVSQDGTTFKTITPRSDDDNRYDLSKARMSWVRYIRLQDESSNVQAKAPGTDIDAICLLNIGVQLPNRVNMSIGSQSAFATEYVTVDVTKVFDKKPNVNNCTEPEPVVVQEQLPPPPPAPLPPAPVYIPTPPPSLPKTGAEPLILVSLVSSLAWVFTRKKK